MPGALTWAVWSYEAGGRLESSGEMVKPTVPVLPYVRL